MSAQMYHTLAIVFGILATVLIVLAVAVYLGYLPTSEVANLSDGELGVFAALSIIVAGGAAFEERQ